jgi:nitroreductase
MAATLLRVGPTTKPHFFFKRHPAQDAIVWTMDVNEALRTRRTIKDFLADPVPADTLERVLTAGLWAQNHRLTQPWRFTILGPETHRQLGEIAGEARQKILAKPLVVAVSQRLSTPELRQEDYAAIACAIQNIQLAAWAEDIGMQWSSGKLMELPQTYELLGIQRSDEEIVALLFFGYPAKVPPAQARRPLAEVTRRLP